MVVLSRSAQKLDMGSATTTIISTKNMATRFTLARESEIKNLSNIAVNIARYSVQYSVVIIRIIRAIVIMAPEALKSASAGEKDRTGSITS